VCGQRPLSATDCRIHQGTHWNSRLRCSVTYGAREGTCKKKIVSRAHEIVSRDHEILSRAHEIRFFFLHVPSRAPYSYIRACCLAKWRQVPSSTGSCIGRWFTAVRKNSTVYIDSSVVCVNCQLPLIEFWGRSSRMPPQFTPMLKSIGNSWCK